MDAATRLRDNAAGLRRRERLLAEWRGTAPRGRQRRVQAAALRAARHERRLAERAQAALDAGWEPCQPSPGWSWGYVEDPRFLRGRVRLAAALMALPAAAAAGAIAARSWDMVSAALLALVLALGLQATLRELLGWLAESRDRRQLGSAAQVRLFNAPMPAAALLAYKRARASGLFDTFTVHSPRPEDFRDVAATQAPSLGLLDPLLIGHAGGQSFLIAGWDLANDLAAAGIPAPTHEPL